MNYILSNYYKSKGWKKKVLYIVVAKDVSHANEVVKIKNKKICPKCALKDIYEKYSEWKCY